MGAYNLPTFERNHPLNNERERVAYVGMGACLLPIMIVFDGVSVFAEGN